LLLFNPSQAASWSPQELQCGIHDPGEFDCCATGRRSPRERLIHKNMKSSMLKEHKLGGRLIRQFYAGSLIPRVIIGDEK
jgi:hypothetical protein